MQRRFLRCKQVLKRLSDLAFESSLAELELTPKPGLVDRASPGAHADMDYGLLRKSACTLKPFWREFLETGFVFCSDLECALLSIREVGMRAERSMFSATGGVNTHKGLVFLYGVLLFCMGFLIGGKGCNWDFGELRGVIREVSAGLVERELEPVRAGVRSAKTHGEVVYLRYGVGGARQEVEEGLPAVFDVGLPLLNGYVSKGISMKEACLRTLVGLLGFVEDTNVLFRKGREGLLWMREKVSRLDVGGLDFVGNLRLLDEEFTREGISPGGTADILTLVIFLYHARKILDAAL